MNSSQPATSRITAVLGALSVGVALTACGHAGQSKPTAAPSSSPKPSSSSMAPASPPDRNDIGRVDRVANDLPPGFTGDPQPVKTLSQEDIDTSGVVAFTKATVDPPQCRSLLIPPYAEPSVGTQAAGMRSEGDQGQIYVVALRLAKPVPVTPPPAGCDHISVSGSPKATGSADSIPGPSIDGVTTTGVRMNATEQEDPDYIYTAALDDQTSVVVMGSTDAALNPQQLLSDLLVRATAAVRGQ